MDPIAEARECIGAAMETLEWSGADREAMANLVRAQQLLWQIVVAS